MSNIKLSLAIGNYDHTNDLTNGNVRAQGIDITSLSLPIEDIFSRFIKFQEWDISEISFAKAISIVSKPDSPIILIPVFPSRAFRHSSIYIPVNSSIQSPADLQGKKIGLPEWAQTAAIFSRGLLQDEYGIDLKKNTWIQAGVNTPGRKEKVTLNLPEEFNLTRNEHSSLSELLLTGEVDAVLSARPPNSFLEHPNKVTRLIKNYREIELAYWKKTHIFPIMHVIAIKKSTYEANRWVAKNLLDAFETAKELSLARAADITASFYPLPWLSDYASLSKSLMGEDFWPYGIDANQSTLNAFTQYAFEQGITNRLLNIEEVFAPESLYAVKV